MNMTVSADTLSVSCSGWTANDQTCTFEVRTLTQDCGFTSDAGSITLSGMLLYYFRPQSCIGDSYYIVTSPHSNCSQISICPLPF